MKASFDVTLSPKDLYRFNMYQTYTGFQGWSSIALGILGFVMAGISFQNGKTSYTLLYIAVGFLFLLYIPVALWFRAKETLKQTRCCLRHCIMKLQRKYSCIPGKRNWGYGVAGNL